jgi:hypothetical protein
VPDGVVGRRCLFSSMVCVPAARDLNEGLALAREMPYPYADARLLQVHAELRTQTDFSSGQVSANDDSGMSHWRIIATEQHRFKIRSGENARQHMA